MIKDSFCRSFTKLVICNYLFPDLSPYNLLKSYLIVNDHNYFVFCQTCLACIDSSYSVGDIVGMSDVRKNEIIKRN